MPPQPDRTSLIDEARRVLEALWQQRPPSDLAKRIPEEIHHAAAALVNSPTKSYRYVLPTQLLAKLVRPELDCRSIQAECGLPGAFDARSVCHEVIVPFDRQNHGVLGSSPEPYVNNPLRMPAILPQYRHAQKDKAGFDRLCQVLKWANEHPAALEALLHVVLEAIRARLSQLRISYGVPNRVSLRDTLDLIAGFLTERTGGVRLQAIAVALFRCIGHRFRLFSCVESGRINAADARTGKVADIECRDASGRLVLAVEVKDRALTHDAVHQKLPAIRERGVREIIFLIQGGVAAADEQRLRELLQKEFATGQNLYLCEFDPFLEYCLMLFGEEGRRQMLVFVGEELDSRGLDIRHRESWKRALERL